MCSDAISLGEQRLAFSALDDGDDDDGEVPMAESDDVDEADEKRRQLFGDVLSTVCAEFAALWDVDWIF